MEKKIISAMPMLVKTSKNSRITTYRTAPITASAWCMVDNDIFLFWLMLMGS